MNSNLDEDVEIGPETMTIESDMLDIEESMADIKDEHIGEKTCLVLETPGGESEITLNGDYETNIMIIDLIAAALKSKYAKDIGRISFYSKPANLIPEDEFLGIETKFAPNTIGAMVGLLQKSGDMNANLNMKCADSGEPLMPVAIDNSDGSVTLSIAKGAPIKQIDVIEV